MVEAVVINSGPLITLARIEALWLIDALPYIFLTPQEVRAELANGPADLLATDFPGSVEVVSLTSPEREHLFENLDSGEAAVIQLAIERGISMVCLDERKGRTYGAREGLRLIGSLGLLGRAKKLGLIDEIAPLVAKAQAAGVRYDSRTIESFLIKFDEVSND